MPLQRSNVAYVLGRGQDERVLGLAPPLGRWCTTRVCPVSRRGHHPFIPKSCRVGLVTGQGTATLCSVPPPLFSRGVFWVTGWWSPSPLGRGHRHPCPVPMTSQPSCYVTIEGALPPLGRCHHRRVWCPRRKGIFAPTALFGLGAINRARARAFG